MKQAPHCSFSHLASASDAGCFIAVCVSGSPRPVLTNQWFIWCPLFLKRSRKIEKALFCFLSFPVLWSDAVLTVQLVSYLSNKKQAHVETGRSVGFSCLVGCWECVCVSCVCVCVLLLRVTFILYSNVYLCVLERRKLTFPFSDSSELWMHQIQWHSGVFVYFIHMLYLINKTVLQNFCPRSCACNAGRVQTASEQLFNHSSENVVHCFDGVLRPLLFGLSPLGSNACCWYWETLLVPVGESKEKFRPVRLSCSLWQATELHAQYSEQAALNVGASFKISLASQFYL